MRLSRRASIAIVIAAAVILCAGTLALFAGRWAHEFENEARAGKAQAVAGVGSLASQDATSAASQFDAASRAFGRAGAMLGPEWVEDAARVIPLTRRHYDAAQTLVGIGLDGSAAGAELAAVLMEASSEPTSAEAASNPLTSNRQKHVDAALVALSAVADGLARLPEDGLVSPLANEIRTLKEALRGVPFLDRSGALLTLLKALRSSEQRILVISQSSAELRPTGGFIGSYGILKVGPEGAKLESYEDVYELPNPPGVVPPPAGARMTKDFQFRDANWWMDFPTSARALLGFWADCEQPPVDGIIAVDVVAMRELLGVFGPVEVPEYSETFTKDNLLERLHYLVQIKFSGPERKDVLAELAYRLVERALSAGPGELSKAALTLGNSADEKHVQVYFTDPKMQAAVTELGWSGAIASPADTTDLLAVSNAMSQGSKANYAMRKTIDYEVALKPDGSAETTLALGYQNTGLLVIPEHGIFRDYLRVYRAPGTVVVSKSLEPDTSYPDVDLPTVVRRFVVRRGKSRERVIVTRVPQAWRAGAAATAPRAPVPAYEDTASGSGEAGEAAHYRLFVARQADLEDIPTTIDISPPAGWRISTVSAWEAASGEAVPAAIARGSAKLSIPLSSDLVFDVGLERE